MQRMRVKGGCVRRTRYNNKDKRISIRSGTQALFNLVPPLNSKISTNLLAVGRFRCAGGAYPVGMYNLKFRA